MKNKIDRLINKIILSISEKWHDKRMLKKTVNKAKGEWLRSGKQQFVLFTDNQYIVINKQVVDTLNRKKYKNKKITHRQLMNMSVYVTPVSCYINI